MPEGLLNPPAANDLWLLLPELALLLGGMLLLLVEMARPRRTLLVGGLAIATFVVALICTIQGPWRAIASGGDVIPFFTPLEAPRLIFRGNMVVDGFAVTMKIIVLVGSMLATLLGLRYAQRFRNPGEFFAMIVFATSAASLLTSASDLLMIYLAVEFLSLASYVVVGYLKFQPRSSEASLKYFLYGAVTAAVMLYGMSLLYGMAGTTSLYAAADRPSLVTGLQAALAKSGGAGILLIGIVMVTVGFGFKTAMAPFHQWVPDVYDGSPLPVMAWLSVASKTAGMAVMVRVFYVAFPPEYWAVPIAVLAALTMTAGNLAALTQGNIKRMLAYSSVAHAGYTLMALAALGHTSHAAPEGSPANPWQLYAVPVYLATYLFMNLGALAVVTAVYDKIKSHRVDDYAGLAQRAPGLAWLMLFFLLSLAGIPPTAGFWGKFVLFASVLAAGPELVWLAIAGFVNSVISVYFYWNVVRAMFLMKPASDEEVRPSPELNLTIAVAAIATLAIFVLAGPFMALFAQQR